MQFIKSHLRYLPGIIACAFILAAGHSAFGQPGAEGGSRAGLGRVYEAAGKSATARQMQNQMNLTLKRAVARARQIRGGGERGRPAPRKIIPRITTPSATPRPVRPDINPRDPEPATQSQPDYAAFQPDPAVDVHSALVEAIGKTAEEKQYLRTVFAETKKAFEIEVAKEGRPNNLAAAYTFFIAASVSVYHDDPEPSDKAIDDLWNGLDAVYNENPDYAKLTNSEKQQIYDTLVAFSGMIFAGHLLGKQAGDADTVAAYRQLAGAMIEMVLKTDPKRMRFVGDNLVIN